ncbi:MAG TPA: ATP-grasp domain-containing protein [Jatrophihabitans sp.]|nr:ATP-grasp domain-containing protein [Jatrophihabitans sp.]
MAEVGQLVVVGYSVPMARALEAFRAPGSVLFVDEPWVAEARKAHEFLADLDSCVGMLEWEFLHPDAADELFLSGRLTEPVSAVLPGVEYATVFAARLAERLRLANAGLGAAQVMRDKARLRRVSAAAGVPNPVSRQVSSAEDVVALLTELDGPVIVKPSGRQAAVGVTRADTPAEAGAAYRFAAEAEENYGPQDRVDSDVLAEQFIDGSEFSVEMLVAGGRPLFANVTEKALFDGPHPVERGHLLPYDADPDGAAELVELTGQVLAATDFDTGFVHCEWIRSETGPYLVECAGRVPGDGITVMLRLGWGCDLMDLYVQLLEGRLDPAAVPLKPVQYAAVAFATGTPGTVTAVSGAEQAAELPGVVSAMAMVAPGATVVPLANSWSRVAMVTAVGDTPDAARANADAALAAIEISTEPPATG